MRPLTEQRKPCTSQQRARGLSDFWRTERKIAKSFALDAPYR